MAEAPPFRADQFERYRRHLALPEFGAEGQRALLAGRVLVVGLGGLGCPTAQYLAAAGVGRLGLLDFDRVSASNLQRQILYGLQDVGRPKVEVCAERLAASNPDVELRAHAVALSTANARDLFSDYDLVVDGADNFPTRYLTNDACALLGKPNVHGSVFRFEGQVSVFDARRGPCYRCLFPQPPPPGAVPSCAEGGVLGVLPGVVGLLQATEAIKLLTGIGEPLIGRLLRYDALQMRFDSFQLRKDPACPLCGDDPAIVDLIDYEGFCGVPAREASEGDEISAQALARELELGNDLLLLDVRDAVERQRACLPGSLHVPLAELEAKLPELEVWRERSVIVHCHKGGRSRRACEILRRAGFRSVANLAGGIEAWSLTVDPSVARY